MNKIGEFIFRVILCVILWISAGGALALPAVWLLTVTHLMPPNDTLVFGLLWGTFGTLAGMYLSKKAFNTPT